MTLPAIPTATYRIQLTANFTFGDAAAIVPYLKALGITHFYASPFLKARGGSTHGYDIVDHNALNPELGGEAGLQTLSAALKSAGMGLILDFVPNHMGVHFADNEWWLDVLEWGPHSPAAIAFDIDWDTLPFRERGGVLLPILGQSYGATLDAGEIELKYDEKDGSFSAWYFQHRLPINPDRYAEILQTVVTTANASDTPAGRAILDLTTRTGKPHTAWRDEARRFKAALAAIEGSADIISRGLSAYRAGADAPDAKMALHYVLERQHYRPAHWRIASTEINYRRFFDVDTLAGLRVEERKTFDAIHKLVQRMVGDGRLQGLRLDHIDGLRDPHQYFQRLQRLLRQAQPAGQPPLYVTIEKILGEGEACPDFAGVSGTTGYEWLNTILRVLIEDKGMPALTATWREISGDTRDFDETLEDSKRTAIRTLLASEFTVLTRLLARIAAGNYTTRDFTSDRLRDALELFVIHMPVYRTYATVRGVSQSDRDVIEGAIAEARAQWPGSDTAIFDFLKDTLTLDIVAPERVGHSTARVRRFAFKVQQFTGPSMAKSLEDTAFYRDHRLLALNEVGGDLRAPALSVETFHEMMHERVRAHRHSLTATATHDTKRGEDARMRILSLAQMPDLWKTAVAEWTGLNAAHVGTVSSWPAPSPAHQYMLYQSMLGAWPLEGPDQSFVARMRAYATKAIREGKTQSSWLNPNEAYEKAVSDYLGKILDSAVSPAFVASFQKFAERAALLGALNSLAQLTLKTMMPGVPDFYQGCETWDLSLVDPDNRRPVDFTQRAAMLSAFDDSRPINWSALTKVWPDGRVKFALTTRLLAVRNANAELMTAGAYEPLAVTGEDANHIIAFALRHEGRAVITVVGRHFGAPSDQRPAWPDARQWNASVNFGGYGELNDELSGRTLAGGSAIAASELFGAVPVAVFSAMIPPKS